jgi:uncharacterized protein YaaQ
MSTKLILAILRGGDHEPLIHQFVDNGFGVTTFSSFGTFLRRKHMTLLIGLPPDKVDQALEIIRQYCPTASDADEHNATIFVLNASRFLHF